MSEVIISPSRAPGEAKLEGPCLFFVNPAIQHDVLSQAKNIAARKHFLFNSNLLEIPGERTTYWAGPALGAPMAVLAMEKLIALGIRQFVIYGWCGSLTPDLKSGDIFLPVRALSEEGTSPHYPLPRPAESTQILRSRLINHLQSENCSVIEGPIWTTDAPFRETREKVRTYARQGIMAVDMEFSALCTVAAFRRVSLAAVMLVSDELWEGQWRPAFRTKAFKKRDRALFQNLALFLARTDFSAF